MPQPQLENGYIRIASELIDQLLRINLSAYQNRVLLAIIRKTYGYNKKEDWVSVSQLVGMTGMRQSHVSRTKKELLQRKLVTSLGNKMGIQKDSSLWCNIPNQVYTDSGIKNIPNQVLDIPIQVKNIPVQGHTIDNNNKQYTKDIIPKGITAFGNAEINELISFMLEKLQIPQLDQSIRINRQYANLLIKASKTGLEGVKWLVDMAAQDDWWRNHITSTRDLYYNRVKIISNRRKNDNKFAGSI